jgi:hypothetical protein
MAKMFSEQLPSRNEDREDKEALRLAALREAIKKPDEGGEARGRSDVRFVSSEIPPNSDQHKLAKESHEEELRSLEDERAALDEKIKKKKESITALENVPIVFDTPDFDTIQRRLGDVAVAGLSTIEVGGRSYDIPQLIGILDGVRAFCDERLDLGPGNQVRGSAEMADEEIDDFLAKNGVTRNKVSPLSRYGMRDALAEGARRYLKHSGQLTKYGV